MYVYFTSSYIEGNFQRHPETSPCNSDEHSDDNLLKQLLRDCHERSYYIQSMGFFQHLNCTEINDRNLDFGQTMHPKSAMHSRINPICP